MKFNYCFLKKRFLLLLIALGIGSVLYANNELKLLTDSLRRVIDEKHVFVKEKEDRINRIKCMLRSPGKGVIEIHEKCTATFIRGMLVVQRNTLVGECFT